ncbi:MULTISPECIES: hypothetical protein [unclassified Vibrio]|uniref:hypothetical protein n=1 Tax=unclassified Vibrio TaxID=2614977 RepID=UPI0018D41503|nr:MULTISPECIES: hypothetical protein [unclassified Vibrio]
MTRLFAIAILGALAFFLVYYNASEKLQKWVIIVLCSGFALYTVSLVVSELIR